MSSTVQSYYDANAQLEWERFDRHRLEFAITKRALAEFLPPSPAAILDCGGGPGRYAIHLTQLGYRVTLLDLAQGNLALARQRASEIGVEVAAVVHGNALDLSRFAADAFDAVLLLGPLYHLVTQPERDQAVREALRVLRPGGMFFAAFITLYAPFRDSIAKGYLKKLADDPSLAETLLRDQSDNVGFTDAWFARPAEVRPWLETFPLRTRALLATEGVAAGHEQHLNALDEASFEYWVDLSYRLCGDPHLLGAADHLLYVGEKAGE
jgi:ubiquinone/menaquinone biosynthesis C-methylase UbiE